LGYDPTAYAAATAASSSILCPDGEFTTTLVIAPDAESVTEMPVRPSSRRFVAI